MRLIDADALIRKMCEGCDSKACECNGKRSIERCYALQVIFDAPTIQLWIQSVHGAIH